MFIRFASIKTSKINTRSIAEEKSKRNLGQLSKYKVTPVSMTTRVYCEQPLANQVHNVVTRMHASR